MDRLIDRTLWPFHGKIDGANGEKSAHGNAPERKCDGHSAEPKICDFQGPNIVLEVCFEKSETNVRENGTFDRNLKTGYAYNGRLYVLDLIVLDITQILVLSNEALCVESRIPTRPSLQPTW